MPTGEVGTVSPGVPNPSVGGMAAAQLELGSP